jgi:citrate lyase beta subunit
LPSPIKVVDRTFSTEKKAVRFAKKIVPVECIKKEKKLEG